jgi:hypothetical protein
MVVGFTTTCAIRQLKFSLYLNKYRITTVLKIKTHIIISIAVTLVRQAGISVIVYGEIFKTKIIVFICIPNSVSFEKSGFFFMWTLFIKKIVILHDNASLV